MSGYGVCEPGDIRLRRSVTHSFKHFARSPIYAPLTSAHYLHLSLRVLCVLLLRRVGAQTTSLVGGCGLYHLKSCLGLNREMPTKARLTHSAHRLLHLLHATQRPVQSHLQCTFLSSDRSIRRACSCLGRTMRVYQGALCCCTR